MESYTEQVLNVISDTALQHVCVFLTDFCLRLRLVIEQMHRSDEVRHRVGFFVPGALQGSDLLRSAHGQNHPEVPPAAAREHVDDRHVAVHPQHRVLRLEKQVGDFWIPGGRKKKKRGG